MSEVKRFPAKKFHPDSEVILALHYDDAKSELAALREERDKLLSAQIEKNSEWAALREDLDECDGERHRLRDKLNSVEQRLADAERRNAAMSNLLEEALDSVYAEARRAETPFASRIHTGLADRIEAALNKPEEAKS